MSKSKLKSVLMSMDKSEIIKMVLELYSARKEAKEYLDFYAEPNEGQKLEEYKHIIREEFYPSRNREPKTRFSVCRKALSDFKKLKPSEDSVAELMVFYMENACQFTYDYGDMWEQFYDSVESNFDKTLRHIVLYDLWDKYDSVHARKRRLEQRRFRGGERMTHERFYDAWEQLSGSEKIACFNEYAREHDSDEEIFGFDEDFFNTYYQNDVLEAVRAVFFGDVKCWNDEYIRYNGYGNLVSMSESEAVDFAEEHLDDIYEHEEIWRNYIEEDDEDETDNEEE